ncbi:MAG: hypothetical protein OXG35_05740 [Acidobacteria bacterium]|nr:hypothetical protein [Acidobacteriota bacterium]
MAEDFRARMAAVQELAALHVEAGVGYHQSGGESVRSRSLSKAPGGGWDVRPYEAYNAAVLHAQATERGVAEGPMEFVTPVQARRMGAGDVDVGEADRYLVETADRRGIAIGLAGKPAVLQRPPAYLVLHVGSQTDLVAVGDPRRGGSAEGREVAAAALVGRVVEAVGERVLGDAFGGAGRTPERSRFEGPGAWASAVVGEAARVVSETPGVHGEVRLARLERVAVRRHNAGLRRSKGERVSIGSAEASELLAESVAGLYRRAVGVVERRRGVRVDFERPLARASYDSAGRCLRPRGLRTFGPDGPGARERFYRQVLVDVVAAAGDAAEREAGVRAGGSVRDRAEGLALVSAVGGSLPGLDHRPAFGADERSARAGVVGAVAARVLVEGAGLEFVPRAGGEEVDRVQAQVVRREGLRSLCSDGVNVGLWLAEARERERGRASGRSLIAGVGGEADREAGQRGSGAGDREEERGEQPSLW